MVAQPGIEFDHAQVGFIALLIASGRVVPAARLMVSPGSTRGADRNFAIIGVSIDSAMR